MAALVISYSRHDRDLVHGLVRLLKNSMRGIEPAVFWDEDIEPGDDWRESFRRQVVRAGQLFVIWCAHSASSPEVKSEYAHGLATGIRVIPVLVDVTPLSSDLAPINGIDLRGILNHPPPATKNFWAALRRGDHNQALRVREYQISPPPPAEAEKNLSEIVCARFSPFFPDRPTPTE